MCQNVYIKPNLITNNYKKRDGIFIYTYSWSGKDITDVLATCTPTLIDKHKTYKQTNDKANSNVTDRKRHKLVLLHTELH